jgi:hypothetical protein
VGHFSGWSETSAGRANSRRTRQDEIAARQARGTGLEFAERGRASEILNPSLRASGQDSCQPLPENMPGGGIFGQAAAKIKKMRAARIVEPE